MSTSTKQAIVASFVKLAAKKPLEKITVRDIVDDCGINRNTFYYHFQDIFAVLEEICYQATVKIDTTLPFGEMLTEFFLVLADYAEQYPRSVSHFVSSIGQRGAERYFEKHLDSCIFTALTNNAPGATPEMRRTATVFLRHAVIGLYFDFVSHRSKIDKNALSKRIGKLAEGVLSSLQ